jgi:hypothetical protein
MYCSTCKFLTRLVPVVDGSKQATIRQHRPVQALIRAVGTKRGLLQALMGQLYQFFYPAIQLFISSAEEASITVTDVLNEDRSYNTSDTAYNHGPKFDGIILSEETDSVITRLVKTETPYTSRRIGTSGSFYSRRF